MNLLNSPMFRIFLYYNLVCSTEFPIDDIRHGHFYSEEFDVKDLEDLIENRIFHGVSMDIFRYDLNDQIESCMMNIQGKIKQTEEKIKVSFLIKSDLKFSLFGVEGKGIEDSYYFTRFKFKGADKVYSDIYFGGFLFYDGYLEDNISFKRNHSTIQGHRWLVKYGFTFFKKYQELSKDSIKKKINEALKKMSHVKDKKRLDIFSNFVEKVNVHSEKLLKSEEEVFKKNIRNSMLENAIHLLVWQSFDSVENYDPQASHDVWDRDRKYSATSEYFKEDTTDYINTLNLLYYYSTIIGFENDHKGDPAYSILPMYGKFKHESDTIILKKTVYIDAARYYQFYKSGIDRLIFKFVVDELEEEPTWKNSKKEADRFKTLHYTFMNKVHPEVTSVSAGTLVIKYNPSGSNNCCLS